MTDTKKLTSKKLDELAVKIIEYLQKYDMFSMTNIYVNNQCFSDNKHPNDTERKTEYGSFYVTENKDVTKIVEYNNPETITMTFEGPLHHALNYSNDKTYDDLQNIFSQYGLYFEQGYAWSLAAYYN